MHYSLCYPAQACDLVALFVDLISHLPMYEEVTFDKRLRLHLKTVDAVEMEQARGLIEKNPMQEVKWSV